MNCFLSNMFYEYQWSSWVCDNKWFWVVKCKSIKTRWVFVQDKLCGWLNKCICRPIRQV
jgi:hypothetical protein